MSGTPKRVHEDGGHSMSSKRPLEDNNVFSNLSGKQAQPVPAEHRLPFEALSDGRIAKVPRLEPREIDRRSTILLPIYQATPSANVSGFDHSSASENKPELRDMKDGRDATIEIRESKVEARDVYSETRMEPRSSKVENEARPESRTDDKELKSEGDSHTDLKSEAKLDKDNACVASSHLSWKEPKDHRRGGRYFESSADAADPWRVLHHNSHNTVESCKEIPFGEGRAPLDVAEAVGENKTDFKGEEKNKEKDRKRKEEKYRDWAEKDKERNDRQNSLPLGYSSKDLTKEDKDAERWDRERKNSQKDKDWKDREKDPVKKSLSAVHEKDSTQTEKETMDSSIKICEKEHATLELKRPKEFDNWKASARENKDRKRDKDQDVELERHDKSNRVYDKESDEGATEGDIFTERDKELIGSGVQQRRRMLRPRGSSQALNREPRFCSGSKEREGFQEKSEVCSIVYKVGECMQELLKSWKEFEAAQDIKKDLQNAPVLEIRIPAEHVTATNRQVKGGQLWGTDVYTDDSDLVAVLMHTGYCRPTASPPPTAIQELQATIRVLPPQDCYTSTLRNNVRSRAWGAGVRCSYRIEKCCIVKKGGGTIDLEPCLSHISAVEPSLVPVSVERTMTTRSAASNALRQQRFVREVTIQYNLCNEPWLKYSNIVIADKGLKKPLFTAARLKKGEVLYLETQFKRYELCFHGMRMVSNGNVATASLGSDLGSEKAHHQNNGDRNHDRDNIIDVFRWSRCRKPLPQEVMRTVGIPLPSEHLEVIDDNLAWEDVQWSQTCVLVAGKEYVISRVHFLTPT